MRCAIITDQVDQTFEDACAIIAREGYTHIELHGINGKTIEHCNEQEVLMIKDVIERYHLSVVNIASTIFFMCPLYPHYRISLFNPNFYVTYGDVQDHLAMLRRACEIAHQLDCHLVRIFPFRLPDNEDITECGTEKDIQEICKNLQGAVEIAEAYNITLVLENCPYSHLPKGSMTYEVIKRIDSPNLKLLWDPANSYRAEKTRVPSIYQTVSLDDELKAIKHKIQHIHIKNYTYDESKIKPFIHRALLDGDIDYKTLIHQINKNYYSYISLEPEVSFQETIQSMHDLLLI